MNRPLNIIALFLMSSPALAAGGSYAAQAVNLILFIAIVVFAAKKPIQAMLKSRSENIEAELKESQELLNEAEEKLNKVNQEFQGMEKRILEMEETAKKEISDMRKEISARAEKDSVRISESAKRTIEEELERAKIALQKEAVEAAIGLAAQQIRQNINQEDHKRLTDDFVTAVRGQHGN